MGATKEIFTQMQEEQIHSLGIIQEERQDESEYYKLINQLQKKEIKLSYSSLKEFGKSPRNFISYKLKEKKEPTESQIFGSLCDLLITEPERFKERYIINNIVPTTDNQKGFCRDILSGMNVEDAFKNNYSRGKSEDLYNSLLPYIEACSSGKIAITEQTYSDAVLITDNLLKSDLISSYINACDKFQDKIEWNYQGWNFIGYKDCSSPGLIIDLKYTKDANPDKFERDLITYEYYMQMAMYSMADNSQGIPECYIIAYDKSMNYSLIKLDYSLISYGIRKYKYLVSKLNQCISENRFNESYNFFDNGFRTVYKPKWAKGFETDGFVED